LVYEKPSGLLHEEILVIFSRQAALTIENAKLFAKVEEMALRDTLTGLYNRRYFQQILDYELNRAKRYRQPISLLFLDVDHFKKINDTYGHSTGDLFLKQIANKFSTLFRTTDSSGPLRRRRVCGHSSRDQSGRIFAFGPSRFGCSW
jgi:GGDEF domain-containing protein